MEPIAVLGTGCRFPGADNVTAFWQLLRSGVDAVGEVPLDRWDSELYYDPSPTAPGKTYSRWGGFLDHVDLFDTAFFKISSREASLMDPQQKLLLEVAWEALENAGCSPGSLAGSRTGVFIGISTFDYALLQGYDPSRIGSYTGTGVAHSVAANRLSHALDLRGPSVAVDTACSSSLLAVHLACRSLRDGESDLALVGGVNLILAPVLDIAFSKARMLSPSGRCKAFDASADGFVRGEGCGVVVLKRLSDALAERERPLALILGSAVGQDGRTAGIWAPSEAAQSAVLGAALRNAGVEPCRIGYVEAHGTGTSLGDAVEARALAAVLGDGRPADRPCLVGSVKTNIGHLEAAAGIAGLIKTVLALHHQEIPPHLHVRTMGPGFSREGAPLAIVDSRRSWPRGSERRLAGVSSFGFGGTNAHVVLGEAPPPTPEAPAGGTDRPRSILPLSACSESALRELARRWERHLAAGDGEALADLCFTAATGRAHHPHRLVAFGDSGERLREALAGFTRGEAPQDLLQGRARDGRRLAFLFTGQGSRLPGAARQLYETQPAFRRELDVCQEILQPYLDAPLLAVLTAGSERPEIYQPALFALEYALAQLWKAWGIRPDAVMGHSLGEYVAACVAGVFSLEEGLRLVATRGRLCAALPGGGGMAVVCAPWPEVEKRLASLASELAVAAYNAPDRIVVSGGVEALEELLRKLARDHIPCRRLEVSHAFHSPRMEPMLEELAACLSTVRFSPPEVPLVGNLTGELLETAPEPADWLRHALEPVRFEAGLRFLHERGFRTFLEIGPEPMLSALVRRTLPSEGGVRALATLPRDAEDAWTTLLRSLGELYVQGFPVDWEGFDKDYVRSRVTGLPTYPFERRRERVEEKEETVPDERRDGVPGPSGVSASGTVLEPCALDSRWRQHLFRGVPILSAAACAEMVLAAARRRLGPGMTELSQVELLRPLELNEDLEAWIRFEVSPAGDRAGFSLLSARRAASPEPLRLEIESPGTFENLKLVPCERREPGPGEVEIGVVAAGLNFRDVLKALGVYPGGGRELGSECAGRVVRVGPGVTGLREGDEVITIAPGGFAGFVVTAENLVIRKPEALSFEEAAAVPVAFLTALYALERLAGLRAGERVLIHSASGGVGLAALEVCRRLGAEVLATAGTPERRAYLESRGVARVMDSRSSSFAEEVMEATGGDGVDVVLSSLPGEAAARSLGLLKPCGRFLELGKIDFYRQASLGLDPFRQGLSYFAIDLDLLCRRRPDLILATLRDLMAGLESGDLRIPPVLPFPVQKAEEAFRFMTLRRHIGKIVLRFDAEPSASLAAAGVEHARGEVGLATEPVPEALDIFFIEAGCPRRVAASELYGWLPRVGLDPGPYFRSVQWLRTNGREVVARLQLPREVRGGVGPMASLLDGALQALRAGLDTDLEMNGGEVLLPFAVERLRLAGGLPRALYAHGVQLEPGPGGEGDVLSCDLRLTDLEGRVVMTLEGFRARKLQRSGASPGAGVLPGLWRGGGDKEGDAGLFQVRWKPAPRRAAKPLPAGVWLVFLDDLGIGRALLPKLAGRGAVCIPIYQGKEFRELAGGGYVVDPAVADHYLALVRDLRRSGAGLSGIVHLWTCTGPGGRIGSLEDLEDSQSTGVYSLLFLTQALAAEPRASVSLWLVSDYAQPVRGGDPLAPEKATLWGLGRVIQKEHPRIVCHGIDLETAERSTVELAEIIVREIESVDDGNLWVACRGGRRLSPELAPLEPSTNGALPLRDGGVYLVTGGQGGIGLEIASLIASRVRARLILVSRTPIANRPERREAVRRLEQAGAEVMAAAADVGSVTAMREVVENAVRRWGRIDGVVHSAGLLRDGVLANLSRESFGDVFGPKVRGTWVLDQVTGENAPDFFVLCSSLASLAAPPGQGNYVAANHFQDVFAHHRARLRGGRTLVINWGLWGETGMGTSARHQRFAAAQGVRALTSAEGRLGFEAALRSGLTQVAFFGETRKASSGNGLASRISLSPGAREAQAHVGDVVPIASSRHFARPVLREASEGSPLLDQLQGRIVGQIAHCLQVEKSRISAETSFFDLGLDSLLGIEVLYALEKDLEIPLSPGLLFEYPTSAALAGYLAHELGGRPEAPASRASVDGTGIQQCS